MNKHIQMESIMRVDEIFNPARRHARAEGFVVNLDSADIDVLLKEGRLQGVLNGQRFIVVFDRPKDGQVEDS